MNEGLNNSRLENKKSNQEMIKELKEEYPKFKIFWNAILEQVRNNKGQYYFGDNPSPLNVARFFASDLQSIKIQMQPYQADENDYAAEMPVKLHENSMSILQRTMGKASDVYYGEVEILDKDGRIDTKL